MTKRILSIALSLMLLMGCFAGITVSAVTTSYTANLGFANNDWSVQEWGENVNTTVTGAGTYTLSWDSAASNALVFVVDIIGAGADFAAAGLELTALSVAADGVEIPVDLAKIVTGDLEQNGNFRIEIYNEYGSTKENAPIDPAAVSFATNLTVTFTLTGPATYDAKLGFANSDWSAQEWGENAKTSVTGAGEYSVSWDGAASNALVFVVDIVGAGADFAANSLGVTALSVLVDGVEVPVDLAKIVTGDLEQNGNFRIEIYNEYGSTKADAPVDPAAITFATNLTVNFTIGVVETAVALPGEYVTAMGLVSSDWNTTTNFGADSTVQTSISSTGTYTLTYEGASADIGILVIDIVGAQTALSAEGKTFQVSDLTLTIDGNPVAVDLTKVVTGDIEKNGNFRIELYNMLGPTKDAPSIDTSLPITTELSVTFTLDLIEKAPEPGEEVESTEEYFLFIGYGGDKQAENDWGWGYAGEETPAEGITAVTATVKSGDTATISLTFDTPVYNSWWFAPALVGTDAGTLISDVDFTVVCKIDGVEVPVDMTKNDGVDFWAETTGAYSDKDCVRLAGGYNDFASNVQFVEKPGSFTTIEYTITFNSIKVTIPVEEEEPTIVEIDKMGTYNAYLMLQTPNWTFRDAHDSDNGIGSAVWGQHITNNDSGVNYGVVTDAVIAGNGTYSVKITDFGTIFVDDFAAAGQDYFNIIAISTDLPAGANVTITDVKLIIDGQVRHTYETAVINEESTGSLQILIQNIWNADVKEISFYPAPTESLEIQFTIAGFDYDNAEQGGDVENPDPADPTDPTDPADPADPTEPSGNVGGDEKPNNILPIIIIAVVVVAVVVVVIVVLKKKKA